MIILTATAEPTATRRLSEWSSLIGRPRWKYLGADWTARTVAVRVASIFCSGVANFLERTRAKFHYSVIDAYASDSLRFRILPLLPAAIS